jgi:hypothetical protein
MMQWDSAIASPLSVCFQEASSQNEPLPYLLTFLILVTILPTERYRTFDNTVKDQIRQCGAMTHLHSDWAESEVSKKVKDILHAYAIGNWQNEPHNSKPAPDPRLDTLMYDQTVH